MNSPAYAPSLVDFSWSITTYRLDELDRRFSFPMVVRLAEGFCSDIEADGFSKDDIIAVDNKLTLHKVAAYFTDRTSPKTKTKDDSEFSYERLSEEILVPLNYKGKVKVLNDGKKYTAVRELAEDFPRFAKACQNFPSYGSDQKRFDVQAGTKIELERIIPGRNGQPDELVIQFQAEGKPVFAKISAGENTVFRAEPDDTEYTIREVIDRFKMPQVVKFIDDEIRRVYTQDLVEGIENMRRITETLQLNRLVTQNVLVGHYKPVEGLDPGDTERFRKRTLVVLPMDHPEIREIEVHVLESDADISDIYEKVFNVYNVSSSHEVVDAIYVEYYKEAPSPRIFRVDEPSPTSTVGRMPSEVLPLIPPRPSLSPGFQRRNQRGNQPPGEKALDDYEKMSPTPMSPGAADFKLKPPKRKVTDTVASPKDALARALPVHGPKDTYEDPEPLPLTLRLRALNRPAAAASGSSLALPSLPPRRHEEKSPSPSPRAHRKHEVDERDCNVKEGDGSHLDKEGYEEIDEKFTPPSSAPPKLDLHVEQDDYLKPVSYRHKESTSGYVQYVNSLPTSNFDFDLASAYSAATPALPTREKTKKGGFIFRSWPRKKKTSEKSPSTKRKEIMPTEPKPVHEPNTKELKDDYNDINELELGDYPEWKDVSPKLAPKTAVVKPMTSNNSGDTLGPSSEEHKCFRQLNCGELVERLKQCTLLEMAQICEHDRLDGSFFESLDDRTLTMVFNLKSVNLVKFKKMRDFNWIPSDK